MRAQHVHFVDDVYLVARLRRRIAYAIEQLAHLVDLGAAGGVQLQHVEVAAFQDSAAVAPLAGEGLEAWPVDLVAFEFQRARQQARGGGLADPAHARQHEGVGDAAGREGVAQRAHHRLLADQILEGARPVLAGDDGVGAHGGLSRVRWAAEHIGGAVVALLGVGRRGKGRGVGVGHGLGQRSGGWRPATTRSRTRYGCFLPDLTGLARPPPIAGLQPDISRAGRGGRKRGREFAIEDVR